MNLLKTIRNYDEQVVRLALGNIGIKIKTFSEHIDLEHPDVCNLFEGELTTGIFAKEACELLRITEFALKEDYQHAVKLLHKAITKSDFYPIISRSVDAPRNNQLYVRLVSDPIERRYIRSTKRCCDVDLSKLHKKGEEIWNAMPNSFDRLHRFGDFYDVEIEKAEVKMAKFQDFGLSCMHEEIQHSIDNFKQQIGERYHGYNRVTVTNACVILAKSMNLLSECGFKFQIKFPSDFFGDYEFYKECKYYTGIGFYSIPWSKPNNWNYSPRIYTINELWDILPQGVQDAFNELEQFNAVGNRAIFDHFRVIVPSIDFPPEHNTNNFVFYDETGLEKTYNDLVSARKAFDSTLIKMNKLPIVLLGEKDGRSYFINHWC